MIIYNIMHSYQRGAGHMLQFQTVYGIYHSSGDVSNTCYNNIMVFWGVMSCSLVDMYQNFRGCYCIHLEVRRNTFFHLNMEVAGSSETRGHIYQTKIAHPVRP